jgi:hypothetical protein
MPVSYGPNISISTATNTHGVWVYVHVSYQKLPITILNTLVFLQLGAYTVYVANAARQLYNGYPGKDVSCSACIIKFRPANFS